ncbi:hypothetical protein CFELI_12895 [Corynebacterium felinum]|nr:hypothetical protein CFELI_12895 [Corynebacterium felinum]
MLVDYNLVGRIRGDGSTEGTIGSHCSDCACSEEKLAWPHLNTHISQAVAAVWLCEVPADGGEIPAGDMQKSGTGTHPSSAPQTVSVFSMDLAFFHGDSSGGRQCAAGDCCFVLNCSNKRACEFQVPTGGDTAVGLRGVRKVGVFDVHIEAASAGESQ